MKPLARTTGLVIREAHDELVVYDTTSHRAHCLNQTAAVVFCHADGTRSIRDLAALLAGTDTAGGEALAGEALERLAEAGLLERPAATARAPSRREVLRQVGLGAALLTPVVTSLLVPSPAQAAATCVQEIDCFANEGERCYITVQSECASKTCVGGFCVP